MILPSGYASRWTPIQTYRPVGRVPYMYNIATSMDADYALPFFPPMEFSQAQDDDTGV